MYVMEYWKQFKPIDQKWHTLMAVIYTFIGFFAFVTNLMVIYYLTRVKRNRGRQDGTSFLINLAVVDAFKAFFALPFVVISSYFGEWVFGHIGCVYYGFAEGVFGFVSLSTLTVMSIERYLIVSNPLKIFESNKKFKIGCLVFIWVYSLFWPLLQFGSKHGYVLEGFLTSCSFDYFSRDTYTRAFMNSMFIGGFLIPVMLLFVFYFLTKKALESKKKEFGNQFYVFSTEYSKTKAKTSSATNSATENSNENLRSQENSSVGPQNNANEQSDANLTDKALTNGSDEVSVLKRRDKNMSQTSTDFENKQFSFQKRQARVLRTIFSYIIFFCIAWLPYAIIVLLAQYGNNIENYITPYTTSLPALFAKTSSVYNPILYTLNNQDFKNYFKRTFLH